MSDSGSHLPIPIVSRDELLQRVDGDMELLEELVDLFLEDLPARLQGLREALDQNNVPQVHDAGSSRKGARCCATDFHGWCARSGDRRVASGNDSSWR